MPIKERSGYLNCIENAVLWVLCGDSLGIQTEYNPDLALRDFEEFRKGNT